MTEVELAERKKLLADYFRGLTRPQRDFISDKASRKAALCSRRAGKTHALLAYVIHVCLAFPGSNCLYIALTRGSARRIIWDELKRINRNLRLDLQFNEVELTVRFQNESLLYINGAETEQDIEKFNGIKLRFIGIDECGSFPEHLRKMVREVLSPCLMDLRGTMVLLGTPKEHCKGLFFEATTGAIAGWSVHRWTWRDNPFVPQDWVYEEAQQQGITEDDPGFQREYCGRWIRSNSSLIYPCDREKNVYVDLPSFASEWNYVLGIDLGWHDETAFALVAYTQDSPILWGIQFEKYGRMTYERIGENVDRILSGKSSYQVCMDTGGLGKTIAESLQKRLNVTIKTAQKTEKMANAAMLRTDLRLGNVKVPVDSTIISEWDNLTLTEDGKEDPTAANHLSDAFLYAYRLAKHYYGKQPPPRKTAAEAWTPSNDELYSRFVEEREREKEINRGFQIDLNELWS
jgi:Terminase large subunit, T4likevirus-type, N-terminal